MLELDLGRLEREGRLEVEGVVAPDHPLWQGTSVELSEPLKVRAEAQKAGADVVVDLELEGVLSVRCGRCLDEVEVAVEGGDTLLFRSGIGESEAEDQEVYLLDPRSGALDLSLAVREHLLLAVPAQVVCDEACKGLCPRCGTNLNELSCECVADEPDERWAPLRRLKRE